jgi:hypothetical protein
MGPADAPAVGRLGGDDVADGLAALGEERRTRSGDVTDDGDVAEAGPVGPGR